MCRKPQDIVLEKLDKMSNIVRSQTRLTNRNSKIVADHLSGATYKELCARYEVSNASISRILSKAEVKDVLDSTLNHLASFAPLIVRNYRALLNSDKPSIRLKATDALAKILGITPTHAPSQINALFVQNNATTIISDQMREIIDKCSGNSDFIDAEFSAIIDD